MSKAEKLNETVLNLGNQQNEDAKGGEVVQALAPDQVMFEPDPDLKEAIEKDCAELDRHFTEFNRRGIVICRHVAAVHREFKNAGRSHGEFCTFMRERFNVQRRTVLNYLAVGRCPPLRDLDIELGKLQLLSTVKSAALSQLVQKQGKEALRSMSYGDVKDLVERMKPRKPKLVQAVPARAQYFLKPENAERLVADLRKAFHAIRESYAEKALDHGLVDALTEIRDWHQERRLADVA